ncbi:MAG: tetratricopeptide repeat protein, partial [Bacteroidia bacterium]|nr:tetratricopeptide repeat protein [Bacteroidia bacterium]
EVYELIARLYRKTNELTLALDYYQRAMLIYSKKNDKRGMATIYNESGVVYEYQKSYDIAISS